MKTPDDWPRVKRVLEGALACRGADREAYLAETCGTDPALRAQVEILLAAQDRAGTFLETPAALLLDESRGREDLSGRLVSSYRLVSRLGAGGMGEVYLAHDAKLDRPVALKVLSPELVADPDRLRRFHQEARAASSLNHPHIVVVHDFGELDERPYIVTEFVEGETLRQRLQRGPLSPRDVVDIGIQIAGALAAAHARGLVHRDIKPDNVMVRPDGYVKVLDFGLAKLTTANRRSDGIHSESRTQPGMVMGTPRYMSPEQARGLDLDARSDIWSLGVMLYEMIAGRPPFEGPTPADAITAILGTDPPALEVQAPHTLAGLSAIVTKALRKDRLERYANADEILADLRRLILNLTSTQTAISTASVTRHRRGDRFVVPTPSRAGVSPHEIRICTMPDKVRIAYATIGEGPPLVKTANWLNHLEFDWQSPVWRHLFDRLSRDHQLVRYDERGTGLSDWEVDDISFDAFVSDLEAVVDAAGLERFALLGISQGCAVSIAYATRHPERVTALVLHGGYLRGWRHRPGTAVRGEALQTLIGLDWGRDNAAIREMFTASFVPDGTAEQIAWFNELQRVSTSPANAVRLRAAFGAIDVAELASHVSVPTLVLHSTGDRVIQFSAGRELAAAIPGARFVPIESRNHLILEHEPIWPQYVDTIRRFLDSEATANGVADAASPTQDVSSIAVLPFADMSPGRDQDYFCDGLAEELINALTHIDGLRVAARTASFQFREAGADIRALGQHLGVEALLEGSVRKADERLRVTVQLIEVATGYHRWSQRFDRTLDDVFAIQDEIAESVVTSLRGSVLSWREKQALLRPHTATPAYEYYLRGRQHLPRLTQPDLERSGEMFERAIELDADYGPAWAGLSMVHATLYEWFGSKEDDLRRAEHASQQALRLTPDLADAHVARGCALSLSRRYDEAAREFEDAIRINPNLFDAYYYFARTSFARGDIEGSAELFRKAADVRQEDFQSPNLLAQSLRMLGRMDEARTATREGIRRAERILVLNPLDARALSLGSLDLFADGQTARALEWSQRSLELYPDDMSVLLCAACLRARLGQKEEALELLERVFARGWGKRDWVEHDPDCDLLRDDPRFKKLLARLK